MSIDNITRQAITKNVSSAYTAQLEDNQIIGDCTSAGFTVTLYQVDDGAIHRLIVAVDPADSSGNTLTITDGTFSTTLSAAGAAVTLETQYDGSWMIVGEYPVTSTATATSSATSAGLAASVADSAAVSAAAGGTGASTATSVATSQNTTQSTTISQNLSTTNSAVLSGVSGTASVATSQNVSQSATVSVAQSTAAS
jgi:hypothetical protein